MSRADLLIPDGWKPGRNVRVTLLPNADDPLPAAGVWRIVDRSAGEPGPHWWAQPHDDAARAWAQRHPGRMVQGCLEVKGLRCAPPGTQLPIPGVDPRARGRR